MEWKEVDGNISLSLFLKRFILDMYHTITMNTPNDAFSAIRKELTSRNARVNEGIVREVWGLAISRAFGSESVEKEHIKEAVTAYLK